AREHPVNHVRAGEASARIDRDEGGWVRSTNVVREAVFGADPGEIAERLNHAIGPSLRAAQVRGMVPVDPDLESGQQPDDLFLRDFQRPANPLNRGTLKSRRSNQVGSAGQDARPLRPAQPLSSGESDEICTLVDKAVQVLGWW